MRKISTAAYTPTEFSVEQRGENTATINAWPFEIGYGITLAHPLRRLLYSSTVGYAATAVKIDGVSHEFDSMHGMLEDIALFIINLKKLRFRLKTPSQKEVVEFSFTGAKEIYGEDLANELVEVVNKDAYLATINEDAKLHFSLIIEKGIGYVPSEEIKPLLEDNSFIALDAFFTPVREATYEIEKVLFEDNPDYEKIALTIKTDGQISPDEAFANALEAMYAQLSVFDKLGRRPGVAGDKHAKLFESVAELGLSTRSLNLLEKANISYIAELVLMSAGELEGLKLGKKALDEVRATLEELGYPAGGDFEGSGAVSKKLAELKAQRQNNAS